jgi:type IV secretion system protein VirB6
MEDFLGELLDRIEASGANFSEEAYGVVGSEVMPLLQILAVVYVAWYAVQLLVGSARIGVGEVVGRVVRVMLILALVSQWGYFNTFFYSWLNDTPEDVGRAILAASSTGITEPTNGLSLIWKTANDAASAFAEQSGYFAVLPSLIGFLIMGCTAIFMAVALAILVLAKVMMWVLIGTAPIFIGCMLFEHTRNYGVGWFNQVVIYALIPLFIYVIAAFLIAAMDPELTSIEAAAQNRTLKLSDVAAFVLLCAAGAFIMLQIQTIAQGIAGGIAAGIGQMGYSIARFAGINVPRGTVRGGIVAGRAGYRLLGWYRGRGDKPPDDPPPPPAAHGNGAASAMQNRISANSTPR